MKKTLAILCMSIITSSLVLGQQTTTVVTTTTTTQTVTTEEVQVIADTSITELLDVFVFPSQNQSDSLQKADEAMCYEWAMKQTGYNPYQPTEVKAKEADTNADGSAVVGAAKGAATGALIGAIAGDAGKGAAIGATSGALLGRRSKVVGDKYEQQALDKKAAEEAAAKEASFKKAFMACMEGKGYTVK